MHYECITRTRILQHTHNSGVLHKQRKAIFLIQSNAKIIQMVKPIDNSCVAYLQ